jgi:aldehyde dehydrogenase (NAD+)
MELANESSLFKSNSSNSSGCTMVLKPSEISPLSSMILAEMIDEIKLPKGVFNLVNGDGAVTGNALTSHPDVI